MTCGVDSLTTFYLNFTKDIPAENKINILTFFDAGTFAGQNVNADITVDRNGNFIGDASIRTGETFQNSKKFADEVGLPLFYIRSNLGQVLKYKKFQPQEFSFTLNGCILLFQKMFRIYYFSSTYSLDDFSIDYKQLIKTASFDIFTMAMISTDVLTFYSAGAPYSRLEKTSLISSDKLVQKYLSVCTGSARNCGYCDKCTRTILSLEAQGFLNCFSKVFDLERYANTRTKQIGKAIARKFTGDEFFTSIFSMLKKRHKIPLSSYIWALIFLAMSPFMRMFKNMNIETKNKLRRWGVKHNLINPFH
jgi:hypothetical protein